MIGVGELIVRLGLSCVLGGAVGLERESIHRPAGLRTHVLVCLGSTLFTIVSAYAFINYKLNDPARIAAQIVSGIGFLGAGTIIRHRATIRGLTTAASLWAVAGIGLAIGCGFYIASVVSTALVLLSLTIMKKIEGFIIGREKKYRNVIIQTENVPDKISIIEKLFRDFDVELKDMEMKLERNNLIFKALARFPVALDFNSFFRNMLEKGVTRFEWDEEE